MSYSAVLSMSNMAYVGPHSLLDVWDSGHGVVQRGDVCDDGLLIRMGHINI